MDGISPSPTILLVEDDPDLGAWLGSRIGLLGPVRWVCTAEECAAALDTGEVCAAVVEARLGGASALPLAERIASRPAPPPILVLAERGSWHDNTRAFRIGAEYLTKTDAHHGLQADVLCFLLRRIPPSTLRALVAPSYCLRRGMTARQTEVVRLAVAERPRKVLADDLGLSENSVKSHIRAALRRTGFDDIGALRTRLDAYARQRVERICEFESVTPPTGVRRRRRSGLRRRDAADALERSGTGGSRDG